MISIPKESSPDIKFGIIWVTTVYPWVNPWDMDSLITDKLEKEIKNIDWIKKITSTSSVWVSSITIELNNWVDVRNALTDIKDQVDKVDLPADAKQKIVDLTTNTGGAKISGRCGNTKVWKRRVCEDRAEWLRMKLNKRICKKRKLNLDKRKE